ncbi:MAG: polyphosphate kinase 1 [Cyclobacteriaceae bacterium]
MNKGDYVHRDINWCDFNARVLAEAGDQSVPLLDRIKFLAIFSSNLDEFFRVKVAALRKLQALKKAKANKWLGYNPDKVLEEIYSKVSIQQNQFGRIWHKEIVPELTRQKIKIYQSSAIQPEHHAEVKNFFRVNVQGYLNPVVQRSGKRVSLKNRGIYLVVPLKKRSKVILGFVNIPSNEVSRFVRLSPVKGVNYVCSLDDIIRANLSILFSDYEVVGEAHSIKLNRDEDYEIEDEFSGNLVEKITDKISKRMEGDPVRFLYDNKMTPQVLKTIKSCCDVPSSGFFPGGRYHNLNDFFQLADLLSDQLKGQFLPQIQHTALEQADSVLKASEEKDYLLHFPYHRYDYVLRFFNEAAVDPAVREIKVTLYRISKKSQIAQALISAAQNGKKVTVFVEVKARYDELNNLQWAKEMEKAGITIIYSLPGLKVHAKVALVVKRESNGKKKRYAYLATGNFNEKTALLYGDHGLMTTHKEITKELEQLFKFLKTGSKSIQFNQLLVAGFNMKTKLIQYINREIELARKGVKSFIIIKINGLDERDMIDKLYEASQAGVKVQLIVRAGCALVPEVKDLSENITAHRLVDMYLEHARVYWFANGGDEQLYLSSADWMNRNLNRRIEVGFPILDMMLKDEVKKVIDLQLKDKVKLTSIGTKSPPGKGNAKTRAQFAIHQWLTKKEAKEI